MRTGPASQLDGKDSHTSCCAVDQDGLSCNELRIFKEALPGRQRREWNGGGLHMCERVSRLGLIGHIPIQLVGNDGRRVDTHQHFSYTCMGLWRIFVDEVIWTASAMQTDCFHVLVSLLSSRQVDHPATRLAHMSQKIR